jgi:hypothetical protein
MMQLCLQFKHHLSRDPPRRGRCLLLHSLPPRAASYARRAVEQAEKLRQQKREEQERLKKDKQFSWNQKVGGWVVPPGVLGGTIGGVWVLWGVSGRPSTWECAFIGCCAPFASARRLQPPTQPHVVYWPACVLQEKRKRDEGKASRGKNYVEEEKRRAREFGIVSGFD